MDNRIIFALVVLGVLVIGGYLYYQSLPTVDANGIATITAKPDMVSVYLNIETKNLTAQDAQNMNSEITTKVKIALVVAGFDNDEIQLSDFQSYPDYDYTRNGQTFKGYVVRQGITVKTDKFERVASIVDAAIQNGALVSYINFELSDKKESEYKQQALTAAGKDAEAKAEATAEGFGKSLGKLISIQTVSQPEYYPYRLYAAGGMDMATSNAEASKAAVNLSPKDMEISASVTAKYKLGLF